MPLQDLDQDSLAIIVSYLSPSRQDVINLSLTHRAFYQVAKYPEHVQISCPSTQFVALTNIFIEDPRYGHKVQSLDLKVEGPKDAISRAKIGAFLDRMPNVRKLKMDADVKPRYMKLLINGKLEMCKTMRDLCVRDSKLTLHDWLSLIVTLPNLRHISIPTLAINYGSPLVQWSPPPLPNLKSLHLSLSSKTASFPTHIMRELLSRTAAFESLEWKLPLKGPISHGVHCPWCPHRLYLLSSENTLNTLSSISTTLVNLKLFSTGSTKVSIDNSRLDLTSFTKLKTIHAGAEFWFQDLRSKAVRDGFYRFMPEGLKSLTLIFPWEICLFYDHDTQDTRFDVEGRKAFLHGTMEKRLYRWIEEIAERKEDAFPGLKEVVVREQTVRKGKGSKSEEWLGTEGMREAFEEKGVRLEVCVRVAKANNLPACYREENGRVVEVLAIEPPQQQVVSAPSRDWGPAIEGGRTAEMMSRWIAAAREAFGRRS